MPSDDIQASPITADLERAPAPRRMPDTFAQALPASLRGVFGAVAPRNRFPPELDFLVAEGVTSDLIEPLARDAAAAGVTGEAALFALGLSDDLYYRLLARHLGALYLERPLPLSARTDLAAAASTGVAPLAPNRYGIGHVQAPRGRHLRELLRRQQAEDRRGYPIAITTPRRLDAMLRRHEGAQTLRRAENGLADWDASLSACGGLSPWQIYGALIAAILTGFGLGANPDHACIAASAALFPLFAAAVAQRLLVAWASRVPLSAARHRIPDRDLPVYTLLVPLFHEARVLPQLVRALDTLDYPVLCSKLTS